MGRHVNVRLCLGVALSVYPEDTPQFYEKVEERGDDNYQLSGNLEYTVGVVFYIKSFTKFDPIIPVSQRQLEITQEEKVQLESLKAEIEALFPGENVSEPGWFAVGYYS